MLKPTTNTVLAREGLPYIAIAIVIAVLVHYFFGFQAAMLPWLLVLLVIYVFREPFRQVPPAPLGIVCPADGKVTRVEQVHDGFLDREAIRIEIDMRLLGVYSVRSPTEGKIMECWFPGVNADGLSTELADSGLDDVRYAQWVRTDEEDDIVVAMTGGVLPLRPHCEAQSGERIGQGHRCGYIPFGAHINLLIPPNSRVETAPGQHVHAGEDVLAYLVHK